VSELLNEETDEEEYRTIDDQKDHMLSLAKKISKKRMDDVEIVDIEENNKELF